MDFVSEFKEKTNICNEWLTELAPNGDGYHKEIYDSMNYSITAGGKRIRPVLMAAVCEMLGGEVEKVKHFACALEFIHTYSLIHDDLPCMDNDDLRRGKPTNHKVFGETMAVLAGDSLLNFAFETALKSDLDADTVVKCLKILSDASGTEGMIGGQVIDIKGASNSTELMEMHKMKTGALIRCGAGIGAVIGGATEEEYNKVIEYADALGLAFQIKDDILDVTADEEILGKPVGSDKESEKCTFINLYGLAGSEEMLAQYTAKACDTLECFGERGKFLKDLAIYLLERNN